MSAPCGTCGGTGTPCRDYHPGKGLVCTRDKHHPGPHVACGAGIYHPLGLVARWRGAGVATRPLGGVMTYHPHDDLPDDPVYPSLPGHEPDVRPFPRMGLSPAEVTVTCSCGLWDFTSQESIGGGVEPWGEYFEDHLTAVQLGEAA